MREDQPLCPVGVVGRRNQLSTHQLRRRGEHQRRLGGIRVPVLAVGEMRRAHARTHRGRVDERDHEVVVLRAQHLERRAERRRVRDVGVDDEQPAHAAVVRPIADLLDDVRKRRRRERDGAGPAPAVAERAAVGHHRQHRDARRAGDLRTQPVGEHPVHSAAEMRPVLLGGPDGQDGGRLRRREVGGYLGPRAFRPQHRCTPILRSTSIVILFSKRHAMSRPRILGAERAGPRGAHAQTASAEP